MRQIASLLFLFSFSAVFITSAADLPLIAKKSVPNVRQGFRGSLSDLEIPNQDGDPIERSRLELNAGKMAIDFDQSKWKDGKVEDGRYSLNHASGSAFAFVIAEPVIVALDALPGIALSHARASDPTARIVLREKRVVNGIEVWCLKMEFKTNAIPFEYYGYYFGGKAGTVQIVTCTRQSLAREYESDFQEFLNGFRLIQ